MKKIFLIPLIYLFSCVACAQLTAIQINPGNSTAGTIDSLRNLGRKFVLRAKPDSAEFYYRKALELAKKETGNNTRIVQLYTDLSRTYTLRRKPEFAYAELNNAKKYLAEDIKITTLERYYFFSGYVFRLLNITDSALYFYKKAEQLNTIDNPYKNWEVYHSIGQLFYFNENLEKAEEYLLRAYRISQPVNKKMDHGVVLNSLSFVYSGLQRPVEYAAIQKEYAELIELDKKDFSKDPVHTMLFVTWKNKTPEEQILFLDQVKAVHIKNKFNQGAMLANLHMADICKKTGQKDKALEYLLENKNSLIDQKNYYTYYDNLNQIYRLQQETGRLSEALVTANELFALHKQLANLTNRELTLNLEKKYETEKKEKEIELLNSKNKLSELELMSQARIRESLERENILQDATIAQQMELAALSRSEKELQFKELEKERQLNNSLARENTLNQQLLQDDKKRKELLWTGVILFALAGIVILYQFRRQLIKNRIIAKQKEDLVMLNREIHHRVKNNLQVISSMLDLQSSATEDKLIAEKFQEGSQRVQSMAFIHQNLYQGENPGSIDIQEYIKMLTANLMQSYNSVSEKITLTTDIEALKLHSDTVIPLGLIINELVSNSLKYAFNNKDSGQIKVVLKRINENLLLQVKDDGSGIPENADVTSGPSFGYKIIKAFSQKLKALVTVNSQDGTDVQLLISKFRTV